MKCSLPYLRTSVFLPQVKVSKEGTIAEYGMLATDDIEEGEVLFTIPRAALLHQGTSEVSGLLDKGGDHVTSDPTNSIIVGVACC